MKILKLVILITAVQYHCDAYSQSICVVVAPFLPMFASKGMSDELLKGPRLALMDNDIKLEGSIFLSSANELDLIKTVNSAYESGCRIMVGFYTSRECLLAAEVLKNRNDTILVSPTCGHEDLMKYRGRIYTGVPSLKNYIIEESKFLKSKKYEQIYIVHSPTDVYSQNALNLLRENLKSEKIQLISTDRVGEVRSEFSITSHSAVVFTTYPKNSLPILEMISSKSVGKGVDLIASPSWIYDMGVIATKKKELGNFKSAYVIRMSRNKRKKVPKSLSSVPQSVQSIVYSSYSMASFAATCHNKTKRKFSNENFRRCMVNTSFEGIYGNIKFNGDSPYAESSLIVDKLAEVAQNGT